MDMGTPMTSSINPGDTAVANSPLDEDFHSAHSSPPPARMPIDGSPPAAGDSPLAPTTDSEGLEEVEDDDDDEIESEDEEEIDYPGGILVHGGMLIAGDDSDEDVEEWDDTEEEEEDDEDVLYDDSGEDEYGPGFFSRTTNGGVLSTRGIPQMPLIKDYVPEPLTNELADELTMRTAGVGLRTTGTAAAAPQSRDLRINPSSGNETTGSPTAAAPIPLLRSSTPLSPTRALFLREIQPGGSGMNAHCHAAGHIAAFHRLPTKPMTVVDRMQSRAYIGRFTNDGDIFVAGYQNERRIRMYDVNNNWKVVKDVHARNLRWTITDIALSSDQNYLLYASFSPVVHLVNVRRGEGGTGATESIANITDIHESLDFSDNSQSNGIWSLRWSPDHKEIIAGTGDCSLYIYDIAAGRTVVRVRGHYDDVNAVAYADDDTGNLIFTGSDDHEVKVWDRRTLGQSKGTPVGVFIGHTEGVAHLDAKGDGRYVISNSKDQSIKLWDVRKALTPKEASSIKSHHSGNIPSFNWDYRWMSYPAQGRVVKHPGDGAIATYRGHSVQSTLCRAYWSPGATTGQRYIYVASACGAVVIYDVITCMEVTRLRYHREVVRDCSWHPYLPLIATAAFDGCVVTWEPQVEGEEEADAEEAAARKKSAGTKDVDESSKRRSGGSASRGGVGRIARSGLPVPGQDQLGDWW